MQISNITSRISDATKRLGQTILSESKDTAKTRKILEKTNSFLQGESYNPGRGAYYVIMGGFVLAPRLLKAREPDEFREIATRDVTTIATILFAMKALQSGMCSFAQKQSGLTLVRDTVGKANPLKRLGGFFNPEGGIIPLASDELIARYSRFADKDSLVKSLKTLDSEGGSIAKMFNVETKGGLFGLLKSKKPTPMLNAAKKIFGEDFLNKTNAELISAVENINPKAKNAAAEGLKELIGESGILTNKSNPITNYARGISATFNTVSLAITVGLLGFGIAKFNELLTAKKHLNKPGTNPNRGAKPKMTSNPQIYDSIKKEESPVFKNFVQPSSINKIA